MNKINSYTPDRQLHRRNQYDLASDETGFFNIMGDNLSTKQRILQNKTEDLLAKAKLAMKEAISPVIDEILNELKAHQIELDKQSEELWHERTALEHTKNHYQCLYEFAPFGYVTLDQDGVIQDLNYTAAKFIGQDRKKFINQSFAQVIADDKKDDWHQHFRLAKQSCEPISCELPIKNAEGWVSCYQLTFNYPPHDDLPKLMRITLTDLTELKQAEEKLQITAAAFDAQVSIMVTDSCKVIVKVNEAFSRVTGYTTEEVVGENPRILRSGLHDRAFFAQVFATVERTGYWHGEIWNKRKNGEIFPALQTITAVTDENGKLTHYVGTMVDITVQKQAEKGLWEARHRLENQVASTQEELDSIKAETTEINAALNVLLRHRENDKNDIQAAFNVEVETTVLPLLNRLKKASAGRLQTVRLIKLLEDNFQLLLKSYGNSSGLVATYQKLTPIEKQVAAMIRQGQPTKVIAAGLNIAPGTVSIHRKNIRKKLGLAGKKDNLHSYLLSLAE